MTILTQKTINKPIHFGGVGLHTGKEVKMNIFPAEPNSGIVFKRIDLNKNNIVNRSSISSHFVASLELAKNGFIEVKQKEMFGNIFVKSKR